MPLNKNAPFVPVPVLPPPASRTLEVVVRPDTQDAATTDFIQALSLQLSQSQAVQTALNELREEVNGRLQTLESPPPSPPETLGPTGMALLVELNNLRVKLCDKRNATLDSVNLSLDRAAAGVNQRWHGRLAALSPELADRFCATWSQLPGTAQDFEATRRRRLVQVRQLEPLLMHAATRLDANAAQP